MTETDSGFTKEFQRRLLNWAAHIERPMPWKGERDPYLIWLSEIILQQTRVAQGWAYFEHFRDTYPTVEDLARASEDAVMKSWEGLGYYSRARNLHAAARRIVERFDGVFPDNYTDILSLPGVGPYTAAAIASFAFGLPFAVLDGNVFRILSRILGIDVPIDSTKGKKLFAEKAQHLLDAESPAAYNQALMDFGALQCVPRQPDCARCPMADICMAYRTGRVEELPVKSRQLIRRDRFFHYFVIRSPGGVLLRKRTEKDIWRRLYEFPLVESAQIELTDEAQSLLWQELRLPADSKISRISGPFRQQLTHQRIVAMFREVTLSATPEHIPAPYFAADRKNLSKFAFPKIIDCYLRDNSLNLF